MSKVAPHNSYVEFEQIDDCLVAAKHFRKEGKYTVKQEVLAYSSLDKLVAQIKGVRAANVLKIDEKNRVLYLEYISGPTLFEKIAKGDLHALERHKELLVNLFLLSKQQKVIFDSDPSNMMFDQDDLVLIDPVCNEFQLDDYSFIVFMWGLVKILLRNYKFWYAKKLVRNWNELYMEYCFVSSVSSTALNSQMVRYIDLVIGWNRQRNSIEGPFFFVFRCCVVIPLYRMVRLIFSRNLVRG